MKRAAIPTVPEELVRFQGELRRLAMQIVQAVLRQELDKRSAELSRRSARGQGRRGKGRAAAPVKAERKAAGRAGKGKGKRGRAAAADRSQLQLDLAASAAAGDAAAAEASAATASPPPTTAAASSTMSAVHSGKRRKWTREAIIEELARWLVNGTAVDASFLTRNGPPGLAAAARRVFGRFDAALNVAGLQVTKLYPDGPPNKNGAQLAQPR